MTESSQQRPNREKPRKEKTAVEKRPRKKTHVMRETVKDRHTSHWDLDYLSRAELEQLMTGTRDDKPAGANSLSEEDSTGNEG